MSRVRRRSDAAAQVAAVVVAVLVLVGVLAVGTPPMQRAATEPRAHAGPAVASPYERAARHLTRINHLLEARQAELAGATGASKHSVARLRAQVASLERQYVAAVEAVTRAR